ncbi:MAG: transcription termination/antitermination protein NusG [Pirellulales bacterium]
MSDEPSKLAENAVAADGPDQDPRGGSGGDAPSAESSADQPNRVAGSEATSESADETTEQAATADGGTADGGTGEVVMEEAEGAGEEPPQLDWYILKVQSNREKSIADALRRRVAVEGLDDYFGQVIVPTEKVTEFKGGKRRVVQRKLYPGYILVQMLINDDTWFLVRETPGIGDFTGSGGKPTPMQPHEVHRIVSTQEEKTDETPKLKISFREGDRVKINEGTFENFEGEVSSLDQASGRVVVMINIFGRSTPVELEYWQVEVM